MVLYEKDFEDWICDNIATVVGDDDAQLVGRQISLPSGGILDVLAWKPIRPERTGKGYELVVIEVKREKIDTSAVIQVLQYMGDIGHAYGEWVCDCMIGLPTSTTVECNIQRVSGIVAAPAIDADAWRAIGGAPSLSYVQLGVTLHAIAQDHVWPPEMTTGSPDALFDKIAQATMIPPAILRGPTE